MEYQRYLRNSIQQYRQANALHGNSWRNYEQEFGLSPLNSNASINNELEFQNDYVNMCKKMAMNRMKKNQKVFTHKRLRYKGLTEECIQNEDKYKLFKIVKNLSIYTHDNKKDNSKLKKIAKVIHRIGIENMFNYLLSHEDINIKIDYSKLKTRVILVLLKEILIKNTFKNSRSRNIYSYSE